MRELILDIFKRPEEHLKERGPTPYGCHLPFGYVDIWIVGEGTLNLTIEILRSL